MKGGTRKYVIRLNGKHFGAERRLELQYVVEKAVSGIDDLPDLRGREEFSCGTNLYIRANHGGGTSGHLLLLSRDSMPEDEALKIILLKLVLLKLDLDFLAHHTYSDSIPLIHWVIC